MRSGQRPSRLFSPGQVNRELASVDDALGFLGPLSFCHQPIGGEAADRLVADILSILCDPGLRFTRKLAPLSLGYVNGLPFGA